MNEREADARCRTQAGPGAGGFGLQRGWRSKRRTEQARFERALRRVVYAHPREPGDPLFFTRGGRALEKLLEGSPRPGTTGTAACEDEGMYLKQGTEVGCEAPRPPPYSVLTTPSFRLETMTSDKRILLRGK